VGRKAGAALILACALAATAIAATDARLPQARQMVLCRTDFGSGAIVGGYDSSFGLSFLPQIPATSRYSVTLDGGTIGGTRLFTTLSSVLVAFNDGDVSQFLKEPRREVDRKSAQEALVQSLEEGFATGANRAVLAKVRVIRLRALEVGDAAIDQDFHLSSGGVTGFSRSSTSNSATTCRAACSFRRRRD
jgi:hypothetical protein